MQYEHPETYENVYFEVIAEDPDDDIQLYGWDAPQGTFDTPDQPRTRWQAPGDPGIYALTVTVSDREGREDTYSFNIKVVAPFNTVDLAQIQTESGGADPIAVYADAELCFGINQYGYRTDGFVSFGTDVLFNTTIKAGTLNITTEDLSYVGELSDNDTLLIKYSGPFGTNNYSIFPTDEGPVIAFRSSPMQFNTPCEVASFPCSELKKTMEIPLPEECINRLQECVNTQMCDRWYFP